MVAPHHVWALLPAAPSYQVAATTLAAPLNLPVKLFILRAGTPAAGEVAGGLLVGDTHLAGAAHALQPVPLSALPTAVMPRPAAASTAAGPIGTEKVVALEVQLLQGTSLLAVQHVGVPYNLLIGDRDELELDLQLTMPPSSHDHLPCVLTCQVLPGCVDRPGGLSRALAQCKLPIMPTSTAPEAGGPAHELCALYSSMLTQYQELADGEGLLCQDGDTGVNNENTSVATAPQRSTTTSQRDLILQHAQVWTSCFEPVLLSMEQSLTPCAVASLHAAPGGVEPSMAMPTTQLVQYLFDQGLNETASCILMRLALMSAVGATAAQPAPVALHGVSPHLLSSAPETGGAEEASLVDLGEVEDDWAVFSLSDQNCSLLLEALRRGADCQHASGALRVVLSRSPTDIVAAGRDSQRASQHFEDLERDEETIVALMAGGLQVGERDGEAMRAATRDTPSAAPGASGDDSAAVAGSAAWAASVSVVPLVRGSTGVGEVAVQPGCHRVGVRQGVVLPRGGMPTSATPFSGARTATAECNGSNASSRSSLPVIWPAVNGSLLRVTSGPPTAPVVASPRCAAVLGPRTPAGRALYAASLPIPLWDAGYLRAESLPNPRGAVALGSDDLAGCLSDTASATMPGATSVAGSAADTAHGLVCGPWA